MSHFLHRQQRFAKPLDEVFAFFSDANNLQAITPASLQFSITTPAPIVMQVGTRIEYRLALWGIPVYWRTVINVWEPPYRFVDEQESGPFAFWRHEHKFVDEGGAVLMHDTVEYREPLGWLGLVAHHVFVSRLLDHVFRHRERTLVRLFAAPETER